MFSQSTPNFGLPQYQANDTLNVLVDFNGAMSDIDTAMQDNKLAAEGAQNTANTANGKADTNALNISTLVNQVNDPSTGLAHEISQIGGSVNTINALIGNGTPTTTDQTIIGAINELNSGKVSEDDISGLRVVKEHNKSLVAAADGTKTNLQLIAELVTAFNNLTAGLATGEYIRPIRVAIGSVGLPLMYFRDFPKNDVCNVQASGVIVNNVPNSCDFWTIYISNAPKFVSGTFGGSASDTWVDEGSVVATENITIFYDVYKTL